MSTTEETDVPLCTSPPLDTSSWPEADRLAYAAAEAELADEQARLSELEAEAEALAAAPSTLIAQKRAELAARRLEREKAEHDAAGRAVYAKACETYGEQRCAIIHGVEGPVVLRPMEAAEVKDAHDRAQALQEGNAKADVVPLHRAALTKTVLYPPPDVFRKWMGRYPASWGALYEARDVIISFDEKTRGKKG